jgi:hypothetical protein
MRVRHTFSAVAIALLTNMFANAQVDQIQVTIEATGDVGLAPAIVSFSDGSNDIFTVGQTASAALENLAETGSPADFAPPQGGPVFGNNPSPPIFTPGGSNSAIFDVAAGNNQFNFAAMVLPSNDWFVGNSADIDISSLLAGAAGDELVFSFATIYDAGTELEDFAFSPGNGIIGLTGGGGAADFGTDQNGVITVVADPDFSTFVGGEGFDNSTIDFSNIVTVRLTAVSAVPEPAAASVLGIVALGGLMRRRRK